MLKQSSLLKLAIGAFAAAAILASAIVDVLAAPSGWLAINGTVRRTAAPIDWANPGPGTTFVSPCPAGRVITVSGSGGLFNGGRCSGSNTTPPAAPSRTATASGPTVISSTFIVDPESGDQTACGTGDPTTTGGANGDAFSSYKVARGPVNNKTDLSNVYAVTHTRADGHPEVYFGAERLVNNGEAHVDFEFLQSAFGLAPCANGVGVIKGHRTQGDLLVAVDFTNGGSLAGFSVRQWHCAADPGPPAQPPDGTVCDPSGGPEHYELITTTTEVAVTVNGGNIPCGGWVCRNAAGAPIGTIQARDLMEGGIDIQALGFTGCFNTFLPHTRVSAPFTASLADFAGPVALKTCRDPVSNSSPGGTFTPGKSVHDVVTLANGGVAVKPTGTITFFLCTPAQVTASGCAGGTQVGAVKTLVGGVATSDPTSATLALGKYCWRTIYTPDAGSLGIYTTASHTNATTECFNVAAVVNLPNTGGPAIPVNPLLALQALLIAPGLLLILAWPRGRAIATVLIAGVILGSSPALNTAPATRGQPPPAAAATSDVTREVPPAQLDTVKAKTRGWRLVIDSIDVDALIQPVGKDRSGAMAQPSSMETVGWFNGGAQPGKPGSAVIDGHFGVWNQDGVFRQLHRLQPGDSINIVWPDGRAIRFEVTKTETVPATAHPGGLFARAGPARLSLITCSGAWDAALGTYSDRLIVTAVPV